MGVVATLGNGKIAQPGTISIIATDGRTIATAQATNRPALGCPWGQAGAVLPMGISASNSRVYFVDGYSTVKFLAPDGTTGVATHFAGGPLVAAAFAVSPDDHRIAVSLLSFTSSGVAVRLYAEDLTGGTNHIELYSSVSKDTDLWPVGWHAGNLVLGVMATCTQGGGFFNIFNGYHLVDPVTANRLSAFPPAGCQVASWPGTSGSTCVTSTALNVLDWSGKITRSYPGQEFYAASLSPDGQRIAACCAVNGGLVILGPGNHQVVKSASGYYLGWLDNDHLLYADEHSQNQVLTISSGKVVVVAAPGIFLNRLPGGL